MTSENPTPDQFDEPGVTDAQSNVTEQREVAPTHGGPGTNWAGIVVAILAVIVFGILGAMFISAMGGEDTTAEPDQVDMTVDPDAATDDTDS